MFGPPGTGKSRLAACLPSIYYLKCLQKKF
nr:hypothetical protein [Rickettsia conorii]